MDATAPAEPRDSQTFGGSTPDHANDPDATEGAADGAFGLDGSDGGTRTGDSGGEASAVDAPDDAAANTWDATDGMDETSAADAPSDSDGAGDAGDSAPDSCVLVSHSNGVGETWQDCTSLGTFTRSEANAACAAHARSGCTSGTGCNLSYVGVALGNSTYYWVYAAPGPGPIAPGAVLVTPNTVVSCQGLMAAATWQ